MGFRESINPLKIPLLLLASKDSLFAWQFCLIMKKIVYKCHRTFLGSAASGRVCLKYFSNLNVHKNHPQILLKIQILIQQVWGGN